MPKSCYIHIPFCRNKCNYCSFVSFDNFSSVSVKEYVDVLIDEIKFFYRNEKLNTLYFGGGTPSLLSLEDIGRLVGAFNLNIDSEVTLELNPETVDFDYLRGLRSKGINRLSVGVQSFDDEILKIIGRIHSSQRAKKVFEDIKEAGFSNYSCDFIYGLPNQSLENFLSSLKVAVELEIPHISLYGLKIEEGCKFYSSMPKNLPDDDMQADMYLAAIEYLESQGYLHYEISNFCKKGYESRHNLNYWNDEEYYGFGVAAHGYVDGKRYSNFYDLSEYRTGYKDKAFIQKLTEEEHLEEAIFLGFRRGEGICVSDIDSKFGIDFEKEYSSTILKYLDSGHLIKTTKGYKFSNEGFLLSNEILCEFMKNC